MWLKKIPSSQLQTGLLSNPLPSCVTLAGALSRSGLQFLISDFVAVISLSPQGWCEQEMSMGVKVPGTIPKHSRVSGNVLSLSLSPSGYQSSPPLGLWHQLPSQPEGLSDWQALAFQLTGSFLSTRLPQPPRHLPPATSHHRGAAAEEIMGGSEDKSRPDPPGLPPTSAPLFLQPILPLAPSPSYP